MSVKSEEVEQGFKRGYYKLSWSMLGIVWLAYFTDVFMRYNIPTVIPSLMKEYGWNASTVGWVDSSYLWAYALTQIPWGYASERWLGAKWTITLGTGLIAVASIVFALNVQDLFVGIVARAFIGAGAAAIWVPANPMLARWFHPRRRGLQTGLLGTASTVGTFVGGAMMPILVTAFAFFSLTQIQSGFLLSAIPGVVLVVLVPLLLRNRPEDVGLKSLDREKPSYAEAPGALPSGELASEESEGPSFGHIMRHSPYPYLLAVVYAGFLGTLYFVYTWFATYLNNVYGISVKSAALIWAIAVVVPPLLSQPFAGTIADKIGLKKAATLALLFSGLIAIAFIVVASIGNGVPLWVTIGLMALMALFVNMWVLIWPFTTIMFPTKAAGPIGGVMNTFAQLVGAAAPVVSGYFIQATGSFVPVFALGAVTATIGFVGIFFLKEYRVV